ncbi:sensor histidine kinase [Pedobacter quisquiliarum]|nr:histidine kinase [Pedobacter quisquiliarum]
MEFSRKQHVAFCLLSTFPVFWMALSYIEMVTTGGTGELASISTICFFCCLYLGRYIAQVWSTRAGQIDNSKLLALGGLILFLLIWMFVHADYPLLSMPALNLLLYWLPFVVMVVALGTFIKLMRIGQQQLGHAKADQAQTQSELRLLQSQLSPHFLFNTLNNLYGLSITRHQEMPGLLLKLSELLRYSVYEAKEQFVPLQDEIAYLNNYLTFEKIRIGERLHLTVDFPTSVENILIAPMLLIVFVENAFKHAKNTTDHRIYIDMRLKVWSNFIQFEIRNSHQIQEQGAFNKFSGVGLENVKKRLDLLYGNQYDFSINDSAGFYTVMLQLNKKIK